MVSNRIPRHGDYLFIYSICFFSRIYDDSGHGFIGVGGLEGAQAARIVAAKGVLALHLDGIQFAVALKDEIHFRAAGCAPVP